MYSPAARWLGLYSAAATTILLVMYAITLSLGLWSLESPDQPIGNPLFTILEILILLLLPAMVCLMIAVHAWSPSELKIFSFVAVTFMSLLAGITGSLHFVILTISRHAVFEGQAWLPLFFEFRWPSVAYALDILAWDVFFPLSMFFAAAVFKGNRLARWIRQAMITAGVLALAGLSGVVWGDMQLRNIGIIGYVGVFLIVSLLLMRFFYREVARQN